MQAYIFCSSCLSRQINLDAGQITSRFVVHNLIALNTAAYSINDYCIKVREVTNSLQIIENEPLHFSSAITPALSNGTARMPSSPFPWKLIEQNGLVDGF